MKKKGSLPDSLGSVVIKNLGIGSIPSRQGEPASSALRSRRNWRRHAEQLGYKRYWVAEHHSIQGLVCSATPVLIGHIAAATKKIRVAAVEFMLPNHAPLVVAEQFGTFGIHVSRANRSRFGTSSGRRLSNHARRCDAVGTNESSMSTFKSPAENFWRW